MGYGNVVHYSPVVFGLCVIFFIQLRRVIRCFSQSIDTLTNQSISQKTSLCQTYIEPGYVWQRKSRQNAVKSREIGDKACIAYTSLFTKMVASKEKNTYLQQIQ